MLALPILNGESAASGLREVTFENLHIDNIRIVASKLHLSFLFGCKLLLKGVFEKVTHSALVRRSYPLVAPFGPRSSEGGHDNSSERRDGFGCAVN